MDKQAMDDPEALRRRRVRSIAIALGIVVVMVMIYAVTMIRLGGNVMNRPL